MKNTPRNPHFDDDRVVWDDAFSGQYEPVDYSIQFDNQWKLFLEKQTGFHEHTGVETADEYIDDRIAELTGVEDYILNKKYAGQEVPADILAGRAELAERRGVGGRLVLDPKFPINYFEDKRCIDIGCGAGRWTKTLKSLGASYVLGTDMSEYALRSSAEFADKVERMDIFNIATKHQDLQGEFDFTICWGVIMCTHDPKIAFENAAKTVKQGGSLYIMVYAPTFHVSEFALLHREKFFREMHSAEEKLAYAYEIADSPENAINLMDMLNTFYNWTIPEDVVLGWYRDNGFEDVKILNKHEVHNCGFHVIGRRT